MFRFYYSSLQRKCVSVSQVLSRRCRGECFHTSVGFDVFIVIGHAFKPLGFGKFSNFGRRPDLSRLLVSTFFRAS